MQFRLLLLISSILISCTVASAQGLPSDFPNYGLNSQAIAATPGTYSGGAGAFWNPAAWAAMRGWESSFAWNDRNVVDKTMDDWGLFLGGHGLGFGMKRSSIARTTPGGVVLQTSFIEDYQLAIGGGDHENYWGLAYGWSRGRTDWLNRDHHLTLGSIYRPWRYLSIGTAGSLGFTGHDRRAITDIGVRPLGTHRATLFADAAFGRYDNFETLQWGTGVEVQPINGVRIAFKLSKPYADIQDKIATLSLGLALNNLGFHVAPHYDKDSERLSTSYVVRWGDIEPDFSTRGAFDREQHFVAKSLKGQLTYRKALLLDHDKFTLRELTTLIDDAERDPGIGGVALNMSGLEASRELLWEVREKLADFKASGKKVYIYFDRVGMAGYYFATVADFVWTDPEGALVLPGYVAGRTFWKGFFEKIGLGVEEWRFFTYKSAFESFSRREMSAADSLQRLVLIQDFFDVWQRDIAAARNLPPEQIRAAIDTIGYFTPEAALEYGLIDSVGSWDDIRDYVEMFSGERPHLVNAHEVQPYAYADPEWGPEPEIALVYAIGECDMDSGIKGRTTSRMLRKLAREDNVKAVVLRADSPGGDPLPSDLVARQMKEISEDKPMIVSQGDVAGSGGYWISMRGDKIYSSPFSITGSIGVIGGWIWNDGFSNKTGFTSDHVKVGEHADLGFGVTLPFLGVKIPDRKLDSLEFGRMKKLILGLYDDFTLQVANSRGLDQAYVDSIGQGRVWSGTRGLDLKLVDEIGTLDDALAYARAQTNLTGKRHVKVVEYPRRSLFGFDSSASMSPIGLLSKLVGGDAPSTKALASDYELRVLQKVSTSKGRPLLLTPPQDIPPED